MYMNCFISRQVLLHEGELYTLAEDGNIIMWKYEELSNVDPAHPGGTHGTNPLFKLEVGQNAKLLHMEQVFINKTGEISQDRECLWYAQDARGKIWEVDLSFSNRAPDPRPIIDAHGGPVVGCATSPISHLVATAGVDKTVRMFECFRRKELAFMTFKLSPSTLQWVPLSVDPHGCSIVVGFEDGCLRKLVIRRPPTKTGGIRSSRDRDMEMCLSQAFKPHRDVLRSLAFSPDGSFLATGSKDATVFLFTVKRSDLQPFGWVSVQKDVQYLEWTPNTYSYTGLLMACDSSVVVELLLPDLSDVIRTRELEMKGLKHRTFALLSVKSEEVRKEEKLKLKREILQQLIETRKKKLAWGLITQAELDLAQQKDEEDEEKEEEDEEEEEWIPYMPPIPSKVLQALYDACNEGLFWLSMADYDAGFLYQCLMTQAWQEDEIRIDGVPPTEPIRSVRVPDSEDKPISLLKFHGDGNLACVGTCDGRLCLFQLQAPYDLRDLSANLNLRVHDIAGRVTGMEIGFDESFLTTTGMDGNVFFL
nr:hypothetical protein BaRGS_028473 [Batillaria attramentaria]